MSVIESVDKNVEPCINECQADRPICPGCGRSEIMRANWRFMNKHSKMIQVEYIRKDFLYGVVTLYNQVVLGAKY